MRGQNTLDFVVIGAQKCATTWLYDCLKNHSRINLRNSKNEDAYYKGALHRQHGDNWYFSQFKNENPDLLKGCISVEYIEDEQSPEALYELNPDIKIIVSLRQPADRALSAYLWYVRKAFIPNIPIEEGMLQAVKHFKGELTDQYTPEYKNIIERGFYAERLKKWYAVFPPHQVKVIFYDEVKRDPLNVLKDIMSFLSIDTSFVPSNLHAKPKKNAGFKVLIKLNHKFPNSKIISNVVDIINQLFFDIKKSPALNISAATKEKINDLYTQSLVELDNLFAKYNTSLQKKLKEFW